MLRIIKICGQNSMCGNSPVCVHECDIVCMYIWLCCLYMYVVCCHCYGFGVISILIRFMGMENYVCEFSCKVLHSSSPENYKNLVNNLIFSVLSNS